MMNRNTFIPRRKLRIRRLKAGRTSKRPAYKALVPRNRRMKKTADSAGYRRSVIMQDHNANFRKSVAKANAWKKKFHASMKQKNIPWYTLPQKVQNALKKPNFSDENLAVLDAFLAKSSRHSDKYFDLRNHLLSTRYTRPKQSSRNMDYTKKDYSIPKYGYNYQLYRHNEAAAREYEDLDWIDFNYDPDYYRGSRNALRYHSWKDKAEYGYKPVWYHEGDWSDYN